MSTIISSVECDAVVVVFLW